MKKIYKKIFYVVIGIVILAFVLNFINRSQFNQDLQDHISIFEQHKK